MQNPARFHQSGQAVAEIRPFNSFSKMAAVRHRGFVGARMRTSHDDYLVVSIIVQNLVEIDAVVSIICNFQYFARLA